MYKQRATQETINVSSVMPQADKHLPQNRLTVTDPIIEQCTEDIGQEHKGILTARNLG